MTNLPLVTFLPGNGKEYELPVLYIADFARGPDGTCAFCKGDPCAESEDAPERIRTYMTENASWAHACPFCDGKAS